MTSSLLSTLQVLRLARTTTTISTAARSRTAKQIPVNSTASVALLSYSTTPSNISTSSSLLHNKTKIRLNKEEEMCGSVPPSPCRSSNSNCDNDINDQTAAAASPSSPPPILDIEDLHNQAVQAKSKTYIDPATGFTVFTEYAHLKRGKCCGNICRHCPYGWESVSYRDTNSGKMIRRQPKVRSGHKEGVQALLEKIESGCCSTQPSKTCTEEEDEIEEQSPQKTDDSSKTNVNRGKGGRHGGTHTSKNVPYTRTGDAGTSMLLSGERRSKDDDAFEAMGTVDELCSVVGVAHAEILEKSSKLDGIKAVVDYGELDDWLLDSMSRLFDLGSHVAKPRKIEHEIDSDDESLDDDDKNAASSFSADGVGGGFEEEHITKLEDWIDIMTEELPELSSFVLPTGGKASAHLHLARTVCRRAERRVLPLVRDGVCDPNGLQYLNRLSDFLFTAARWTNFCEGIEEVQYRRYFRGAAQRNRVVVNLRDEKKESK